MKKKKYFGTDGIRGRVGESNVNPEFVLKLGWAIGKVLSNGHRKKVVIGKDTRVSGYMLESALEAGLSAAGVDVRLLGPMPTPAIAYLTQTLRACAGIVISASHNLFEDNGIKFFSADGSKLPDKLEFAIEEYLDKPLKTVASSKLGKAVRIDDASGRYIEFCKSTIPSLTRLTGLKIVVDCANGATYHIAPNVFKELGADVISLANYPNGFNINEDCGSTRPEKLRAKVLEENADIGVALDGDGDRVILVDQKGQIIDGDIIIYAIAKDRLDKGLHKGGIVGTVMSNLGLEKAIQKLGLEFSRANVGDRYVLEMLKDKQWSIGGEPSGHIVCLDKTTTGDGIIAALQVLTIMIQRNIALHELVKDIELFPQYHINIKTGNAQELMSNAFIKKAISQAEQELHGDGRILVRPSGTEPLLRIMVEGPDETLIKQCAKNLEQCVYEQNKLFKTAS